MLTDLLAEPLINLAIRFCIDLTALLLLVIGIYYRRYGDKELVISASLFNIFGFAVLTILSSVQFSVSAGFGLFAILALFTLRSEQISKTEITYFFGSVAIAVICSVQGTPLSLVLIIITTVIVVTYLIDNPRLLSSVDGTRITLDKIETYALSDSKKMCADLSKKLGVNVFSYQIKHLDFINDLVIIHVNYKKQ